MQKSIIRLIAVGLTVVSVAACSNVREGPAGQPSSTDVNPITGSRGGTNR